MLLEAGNLGLREGLVGHVGQRGPRQSSSAERSVSAAPAIRPVRLGDEPFEAADIDLGGVRAQDVARRLRDQPAVAELLSLRRDT